MNVHRRQALAGGAAMAAMACFAGDAAADDVAKSSMPEKGVILVATVKAKPGQEDAVRAALLTMVEPTRKEEGCLCYKLHQAKEDPTRFMFYEQWARREDLDAHSRSAHMKALGPKLEGKTEPSELTFFELVK